MKEGLALISARRGCRSRSGCRRGRQDQRHDDLRRRQHVRRAAHLEVDAGPRHGVRLHRPVLRGRLGRRHRGDHEPPGRLRRLGRSAVAHQAAACNGCAQIPWALVATAVAYNVPGAPAHLRLDGLRSRNLPRPDHQLERSCDRGAEPGREHAGPEDHAGLPVRRLGYLLQLQRLPLVGPLSGRRRSASRRSRPSRPVSGAKGPPASPASSEHARRVAYVDVAYAITNHIRFAAVKNAAGKFLYPEPARYRGRRAGFPEGAGEQRDAHRQPAEVGGAAYPICTYTYIIVPLRPRTQPSCER